MKLVTKRHKAIIEGNRENKNIKLMDQGEIQPGETDVVINAEKPMDEQLAFLAQQCQEENHKTKKVMLSVKNEQSEPFNIDLMYLIS